MKRNLYQVVISLMVASLVACQSAPAAPANQMPASTNGTIAEFFKGEAARWLSIALPEGWVAKLSDSGSGPSIVVTDNWEKYQNQDLDNEALGIYVRPPGSTRENSSQVSGDS